MKHLVFFFLICISNQTFGQAIINRNFSDMINSASTCTCNGLPGNAPIVGLFQTSNWGTSLLQAFPLDDPKAFEQCSIFKEELIKLNICH